MYYHSPSASNGDASKFATYGATKFENTVDILAGDDGFYSDPNIMFVDFIVEPNNVMKEMLCVCSGCMDHNVCLESEVDSADLTLYKSCQAAGCCGDEPPNEVPDIDLHIKIVLKFIINSQDKSNEPDICKACDMFCGDSMN
jgi:hypothetical protein